jgi:hypothetical protein
VLAYYAWNDYKGKTIQLEIMGKTRTIQVKVSDWEYQKYSRLALDLSTTLSEMGRDALLIALPTLTTRAKLLQEKAEV